LLALQRRLGLSQALALVGVAAARRCVEKNRASMIPRELFGLLQCPTCGSRNLYVTAEGVHSPDCGVVYPFGDGWIDLLPRNAAYDYVSKYVAEEEQMADELDYRDLAPPLLAAGVRNRALVRLLDLRPGDVVLDNGCGNAKFSAWNADRVRLMVGSDPVTLFADAAVEQVALAKADSRALPFAADRFDKAFSLDMLEHFPRPVINDYLRETARVLKPGGRLLIFSNTRELSPIQPLIDISRRIGRAFVRVGVYDFERQARRKSDHIKALATWDDVLDAVQQAGLRPVRTVFWNSLFTTFVEHVLMKLGEAILGKGPRATGQGPGLDREEGATVSVGAAREIRARKRMKGQLERRGAAYYALLAVTLLMELDLRLFWWMRTGPYFVVVEKPH
jgi:ubiquinone/menaquinone biosynthesis C-methylase UbiE